MAPGLMPAGVRVLPHRGGTLPLPSSQGARASWQVRPILTILLCNTRVTPLHAFDIFMHAVNAVIPHMCLLVSLSVCLSVCQSVCVCPAWRVYGVCVCVWMPRPFPPARSHAHAIWFVRLFGPNARVCQHVHACGVACGVIP